jgi:hypothetical protein
MRKRYKEKEERVVSHVEGEKDRKAIKWKRSKVREKTKEICKVNARK